MRTVRSHAGDNGAIIASGDSDMLQHGRGTYSYVWPRDGAFAALALDKVGSFNAGKRFFQFCNEVITDEGYFMHKYRPDGSLGSSWHPWIRSGNPELPIQEDETALVIYALWEHYKLTKDLEFVENVYNSLIEKGADFLVHYTYKDTGLPYPSYDLWEEKYGISTFSTSATYGALIAAAKFAKFLGKEEKERLYLDTAEKMKKAIIKYLYNQDLGMFVKLINFKDGEVVSDNTLDMSSFYGVFKFGVLDHGDILMKKSIATIEEKLCMKTGITGVPRYEEDNYFRPSKNMPPNPWFVTTLWLAQYYIAEAKKEEDLDVVKEIFNWVCKHALSTGILSEQLNPYTGEQLSATPLTWSHAEYLITIIDYLEKL
jgi:GH15 family glucan-1,4-alpha-glucosidase